MTEPDPPPQQTTSGLSRPQVEDVFHATEQVRAADFPAVPAELLTAVLAAERDHPDSRSDAARAVQHAVDTYLAEHPAEGEGTAS